MYQEYHPHELLAPYVDKYWVVKGRMEPGAFIRILPDGCTDFIFNLDDEANLSDKNQLIVGPHQVYFVGPMRTYSELLVCATSVHMIGVRFTPCGLTLFTREPMSEFTDQRICFPDQDILFNKDFAVLLKGKQTLGERLQVIELYLLFCLQHAGQVDKQVVWATKLIGESGGKMSMEVLMDKVCLCQRHFERRFKYAMGFTPKEYSRIVKFRRTMDALRRVSKDNLFTIAVDCGYYDQSHLAKEFRKLSGSLPSAFSVLPGDVPITYLDG